MKSILNSEKLRTMRTRAGLSQWHVATALGKTQGWLSNIELGYVKPHRKIILEIARAIEVLAQERSQSQIYVMTKGSANSQSDCDLKRGQKRL
jgi:transcriptional regulator with XRE-family HTH domain